MSDITDDGVTFDSAKFRQVLGHFPTGVTVITAMTDGQPGRFRGGLVRLAVARTASCAVLRRARARRRWPKIQTAGRFCANILADDQEDVCRVFASKAEDKFAEIGWKHSGNGSPLIGGALAYIDCEIAEVVESGDHYVVIGGVSDLDVQHEGGPLVFFRGGYGRFAI